MRTPLYPSNEVEEVVQAGLDSLRQAAQALHEEADRPAPDVSLLAGHAEELGRSAQAVVKRSSRLASDSPYWPAAIEETRTVVDRALRLARELGGALQDAIAFEEDLADVLLASGKLEIGHGLRESRKTKGWSLRTLSERSGLATGYLSEIERGRTGLPSEESALALDKALGTSLHPESNDLRAEIARLRSEGRDRRRQRAKSGLGDPREEVRLAAVAEALRRNERLLLTVEHLIAMSDAVRSGIGKLVEELAGEGR